jgi:uncharacterized membrane protein
MRVSGARRAIGRYGEHSAAVTVGLMALAYAVVFSWLSIARHRAFASGRFDLGNMEQAIWSTLQGRLLESTETGGEQFSRFGAHVDPILVVLAPLYAVWSSPEALLVAQAAIVATGAIPAFLLGRRWLGDDRLGLAVAAVYLLYPPLQFATLFDFHPVTLAAPLLLFCIWAAEVGAYVPRAIFGTLAALTQEQVGLALIGLALWMAVRHPERRRAAGVMAAAAAAWVVVSVAVIIPRFSLTGGNPQIRRYDALGEGEGGVLASLFTRPWEAVEVLATPGRAAYLLLLLLPLLALSLLAPLLLLPAVPQLLINLLAADGPPQTIHYHYAAVLTPFLIASATLGLARLRGRERPAWISHALARPGRVAAGAVAAGVLAGVLLGPLPFWRQLPVGYNGVSHHAFTRDAHAQAMARAVALVPPDASVSASNSAGAHLSGRRRIHLFPEIDDARWILVDVRRPDPSGGVRKTLRPVEHALGVEAVVRDPAWQLVVDEAGVRLFRRVEATAAGSAGTVRSG